MSMVENCRWNFEKKNFGFPDVCTHKRVQRKSKADAVSAGIIHQGGELTVQRLSSGGLWQGAKV